MEKLELLAPAQNKACAISAINCGADAIYIGASAYGARKNASNSLGDIKEIIDYAHLFNVKVYITLNTILNDEELKNCEKLIHELYEIKADAIIIQDMGILELDLPPIALHASTQCDNRTTEKIKFLEDIGFKRAILARELPLNKIEEIKKNTHIQLEHFIHGALCVSYSGQCYMSEYIGKRSANKGECAQACRMKYSLVDENNNFLAKDKYLLSLKDNNLSKHLDKLINAGVMSFKIEGRLKDENYIKNTVLYYHKLLKNYPRQSIGKVFEDFEPSPDKTFNRGFCDDYLFNKKDNIYNFSTPKSMGEFLGEVISKNDNNFVIKTKKEINAQDGLCFVVSNDLQGCLVNKIEIVKNGIKIIPNKKLNLKIGDKIYRNIDVKFNKTLENSKIARKLAIDFIVQKDKLIVKDERNNKEEIIFEDFEIANNQQKMKENFEKCLNKSQDLPYFVKNITFDTDNLPFIPVSKLNELRRTILNNLSLKILSRYKVKKGGKINIAKFPQEKGDYRLNVHNNSAKEFYEMCDCEVLEKSLETKKENKQYELMRTKHCLKRAFLGCDIQKKLYLIDRTSEKYPLKFDCKNCEMIILSPDC
ncbi:MAG: U32 family peptidase [Candidatus Gastranaerophilales bacterium]|nr:U32 family peptidase [Candidatus Gastranaerophilales bacterium]